MNPLVSVIVPHHLNANQVYLDLCLGSILASKYDHLEVLCISDSALPPKLPDDPRVIGYHRPDLNNATRKLNFGASQASGKYLWFISDDVMIESHSMRTMVEGLSDNRIIAIPMSNGDNGSQFVTSLPWPIKLTHEEYAGLPSIEIGDNKNPFLVFSKSFVSYFAVMMSKSIWQEVGELDEAMDQRWNDCDHCIRASKLGIAIMINLGAFALHFGDKTLPQCTTPEQYASCDEAFKNKWHSPQTQL